MINWSEWDGTLAGYWFLTDEERKRSMAQTDKLRTLFAILRALADAIEQQFGREAPAGQQHRPEDLDQALAHAGDVARRVGLDPTALLAQSAPEEVAPPREFNT